MAAIKKKVLYVITKSVWGGAQRYVYDLATNLPKEDFEVLVITGGSGPLVERLNRVGIRTETLPILQERRRIFEVIFSFMNIRALLALFNIYRKERPDIIHLNSSKIGGLGALAANFYKLSCFVLRESCIVKTVFTVHGWPFKEDRFILSKITIWFLSWLSSLFQDKIILINTADYETARRFVPERKLVFIHNGVAEIDFLARREARAFFAKKIERPAASDTILVGTVAELTKNKGLDYLIESALDLRSNFLILIIGGGEDKKRLEARIKDRELSGKVFLLDFLPDAARYFKGFDVFVLPSLKEGLPYTVMEAMAAGLPIVATKVGGIPDLIENHKNGFLVAPKNPQTLVEALERLILEPRLAEKFGEENIRKINTRFRLQGMLEKTVQLYQRLTPRA